MKTNAHESAYQLKITLSGTRPAIWRRVRVSSSTTLAELHGIVQISMGWMDSHLHMFATSDGQRFGDTRHDEDGMMQMRDESAVTVGELLRKAKQSLTYEYDFGDGWGHSVVLEKVLPLKDDEPLPLCVHAVGQCPPEDVGGIGGFYAFLEAVRDPAHPEHDELLAWWGEPGFDPGEVNVESINELLQNPQLLNPAQAHNDALLDDFHGLSPEQIHQLIYSPFESPDLLQWHPSELVEQVPAIRMTKVLFMSLADKEVKLTAKGNMPMALVRAMLDAGGREELMGQWPGTVRSEDDAMPVHVTRLLAELAGLTKKQKGRLSLTKKTATDVAKGNWWQIYRKMLEVMMVSFNWAYLDGYDDLRGVQMTAPFAWWLIHLYGNEWRPEAFYAQAILQAFPMLTTETTGSTSLSADKIVERVIDARLFRLFHWLGLVERYQEVPGKGIEGLLNARTFVRKTALFDGVLRFS